MSNPHAGSNARKSRAAHERAGTFRKDRHADLKNPEPSAGRPDPPGEFGPIARAEWDRLLWAFDDMGMLVKVDGFALYQHCQLFAETEAVAGQQAEARAGLRILEENLGDIEAEDKVQLFAQIVTLHKLVSKCTDQLRQGRMALRQYLVEFGLTPASRGRVKLPPKPEQVDEFTAYQKQRRA